MTTEEATSLAEPPRLALLLLKTEIWVTARLLPFVLAFRDLSQILRLGDVERSRLYTGAAPETIACVTRRSTRKPWLMRNRRCLRQGLIGYRFLRKAGYEPELHFGIDVGSVERNRIDAHCWVVLDGKPVVNDILEGMVIIHVHDSTSVDPAIS